MGLVGEVAILSDGLLGEMPNRTDDAKRRPGITRVKKYMDDAKGRSGIICVRMIQV
jgi:hypothetical protein